MLGKINSTLKTPVWLFWLLIVTLVMRIPSFFEPYTYGDEMIYLILGEGIRQGVPLYTGVHDNKPPLLYLFAAISGSLFWFKALLAIWHLVTIYIFWRLTQLIFPKKELSQKVATFIFALLTTLPLLEGNIINSEIFMVGPTILAFLLLIKNSGNPKCIFLSGVLFSISALFKMPAAFEVPVIIFYWLITLKSFDKTHFINLIKKSLVLLSGFLLPVLISFLWFYLQGSFKDYVIAAYLQNFGYLSSWRPGDIQKPFLLRNLPLIVRGLIVLLASAFLLTFKHKLSKEFKFITLWLFFTLFAVTLSERPYPHYLIQSVAPIALLFSFLFTKKNVEQVYVIIPLAFAFIVPVYYRFWYYPTASYYGRFYKLATGQLDKENYLATYGDKVNRNYRIANFVASSTDEKDKIFVWGDGVTIYALSHRLPPIKYVADYHISDFSSGSEVINGLRINKPEFIVILPESKKFPELEYLLKREYAQTMDIEGAVIWKLLSPEVRSLFSN